MIIIPAGTPHYFSEISESLVYTIVRIDPGGGLTQVPLWHSDVIWLIPPCS